MKSQNSKRVALIAFGHPSDTRTFSGYSSSLAKALREAGLLRSEYSLRDVRPLDCFAGAFGCRWTNRRPKVTINRSWMWSDRGNAVLAKRFHRRLRAAGEFGPLLQIGTLVTIPESYGPHFVLTDMTIPQARRAKYFDVSQLPEGLYRQAVQIQRRVFANSRAVFTLSEWAKRSVVDDFGVDPSSVHIVYAGSNLVVGEAPQERRVPREILFVGIDWERKGGPLLLEAFRALRRQLPDARLTIIGCRPTVDEPGIEVLGFLDKNDPGDFDALKKAYARAGVFCLPSLFDPFPNAVIEASAAGLPVVAIDNGSRREAVVDSVTGRLASEATPAALANALFWVVENARRRSELGAAALTHAHANFTWERVVERIRCVVEGEQREPSFSSPEISRTHVS